jgi:hypothetical protein
MKDTFTVELSRHQAKVLNSVLALVNQLVELPPNAPVFNLPTGGPDSDLVKAEFKLLHEEVLRQITEQDHSSA